MFPLEVNRHIGWSTFNYHLYCPVAIREFIISGTKCSRVKYFHIVYSSTVLLVLLPLFARYYLPLTMERALHARENAEISTKSTIL